jgi:polar amino acid transport system permease protein
MRLDWDWAFAATILPRLLEALEVTVIATLLGSALALSLGLLLAVLRRSPVRAVSAAARLLIEFVRSTPLLIQIYVLFYVMPRFGVRLSAMTTGVLALGLHYGAYTAEVYRAGIEAVPRGQWEAAAALNLGRGRTFLRIVLPQALPPIVPALGNYVIAMFKDTPLLSTITVIELLYTAKDIGSETFRYLEPFTLVGVLFLAVSLLAAVGVRAVERRLPSYST